MILRSRGAKAPLLSVDLMPARVALNLRESGAVFPCKWCSVAEIYNLNTPDNMSKNTHTKLFKLQFSGAKNNKRNSDPLGNQGPEFF